VSDRPAIMPGRATAVGANISEPGGCPARFEIVVSSQRQWTAAWPSRQRHSESDSDSTESLCPSGYLNSGYGGQFESEERATAKTWCSKAALPGSCGDRVC